MAEPTPIRMLFARQPEALVDPFKSTDLPCTRPDCAHQRQLLARVVPIDEAMAWRDVAVALMAGES